MTVIATCIPMTHEQERDAVSAFCLWQGVGYKTIYKSDLIAPRGMILTIGNTELSGFRDLIEWWDNHGMWRL